MNEGPHGRQNRLKRIFSLLGVAQRHRGWT
jgi:hypothetical protein